MLKAAGKLAVFATGVTVAAAKKQLDQRAQQASVQERPSFQTGDQKLQELAKKIRPDSSKNPVFEAVQDAFESRKSAFQTAAKVGVATINGEVDPLKPFETLAENAQFTAKAIKVAATGGFDGHDATRVAGAGAMRVGKDAIQAMANANPFEAAKATAKAAKTGAEAAFSLATTTESGFEEVQDAAAQRLKHEGKQLALQFGVSTVATVAATAINPVLGAAVGAISTFSAGCKTTEVMAKISEGPKEPAQSAMHAEFKKIVNEKA